MVLQVRLTSLLCLRSKFEVAAIRGHGKPWFFHGYSTLCKPLWGNEGLVVAAYYTLMDFGCFGCLFAVFHSLVKTLALLQGSPASSVSVYFVLVNITVF